MTEAELDETPQWFVDILQSLNTTESLRERLDIASATAYSIARMRVEREKVGFIPLAFGEYLEGLATLAGVSLGAPLRHLSIADHKKSDIATASGFGRLAHMLGVRLEELILHLRVSIAEEAIGIPLPMVAAHRGELASVQPRDCDRFLRQIEGRWPSDLRAEMDGILQAAAISYRECSAEDFEVVE